MSSRLWIFLSMVKSSKLTMIRMFRGVCGKDQTLFATFISNQQDISQKCILETDSSVGTTHTSTLIIVRSDSPKIRKICLTKICINRVHHSITKIKDFSPTLNDYTNNDYKYLDNYAIIYFFITILNKVSPFYLKAPILFL